MSGSNLVAMKKIVQQLRFEASINRVKVIVVFVAFLSNNGKSRRISGLTRLTGACSFISRSSTGARKGVASAGGEVFRQAISI